MPYLDNNATTKIAPEVKSAMDPYLGELYANPSSLYTLGAQVRRDLEGARVQIARSLGVRDGRNITFTSGATESNNAAVRAALKACPQKKRIVTTKVEHSSVRNLSDVLSREGYEVVFIGVNPSGALNWEEFIGALTPEVAIVSIMWANNETGVIQPMKEIGEICKRRGILFMSDATQAVGKIPVNPKEAGIHLMAFTSHKMYGPKGVGALFVNRKNPRVKVVAQIDGGGHERGMRSGTLNVPGIVGFGKAAEIAQKEMKQAWAATQKHLKVWQKEATRLAVQGEKELVRTAKLGRIQLDVLAARRKQDQIHREIGKQVLELKRKGKIDPPELKALFARATGISKQIKSKEAAFKRARAASRHRKTKK